MRFLIADDDMVSRHMLAGILQKHGVTAEVVNGVETVQAFKIAKKDGVMYDAIFLDIMMPELDGKEAGKQIRDIEKQHKISPDKEAKIVMLTALDDPKNVIDSYYGSGATSYIVKPITRDKIEKELKKLRLI